MLSGSWQQIFPVHPGIVEQSMATLTKALAIISVALACARCTLLVDTEGLQGATVLDASDASDAQGSDAQGDLGDGFIPAETEAATDAQALPDGAAVWPNNGHAYLVVVATISWSLAKERAETLGGHLATIGSFEENLHCLELTLQAPGSWNDDQGPWLGGYQAPDSIEPAGGWLWITGESFTITNWKPTEPNNYAGIENRLSFGSPSNVPAATWNDTSDAPVKVVNAFVVELE